MSDLEDALAYQIRALGLPEPVRQFRLPESNRRFAYDFCFVDQRLLVEVQGSVWVAHTGHTSGAGVTRDADKLNLATMHGYRVLQFTGDMVKNGKAVQVLQTCLRSTTDLKPSNTDS